MERWREPWIEQNKKTLHWFLRWRERGDDGVIHRRGRLCESKSDALKAKDVKRLELLETRASTSNPHAKTAELYAVFMREMETVRRLRPGALRAKRQALDKFVAKHDVLGKIARETLKQYRDDLLASDLSPVSVAIRMREVKAFVRWLHFEGHLKDNPWVKIELPTCDPTPRFLQNDELVRLNEHAKGQFKAILRMAYMTGMRLGEILAARWDDVSLVKRRSYITVLATTAKNRRSRTIVLRREVVDLLGTRRRGERIFEGWDKWKVRHAWDTAKEKAGITGRCRFHDLRHTFCKLYLQGGGTIADLMSITGHQSIVMMRVYAHFETRYRAERIDAIHFPENLEGDSVGRGQDGPPQILETEGDLGKLKDTLDDQSDDDFGAGNAAVL